MRRAELLGQPVEILVPDAFRGHHPALRRSSSPAIPNARPMGAGRDLFARRKDGSEFPVEIGLNPIETEDGTDGSVRHRRHFRPQAEGTQHRGGAAGEGSCCWARSTTA